MSVNYGQGSTFESTDKQLFLNIEKEVRKYPAPRIELLKRLKSFDQPVLTHKIEWSRRDNRPVKALVVNGCTSGGTQITVDTPGVFNVDDILEKPNGQQMVVESVSGGLLVTFRALYGTAEALAGGQTVKRIGMASAQGKDADDMVTTGYEDLYNYTSILEDVINLSGTEHNALIRGHENSGELIARKQRELLEIWQSQCIIGRRSKDDTRKVTTNAGVENLLQLYSPTNILDFGGVGTWSLTGDNGPLAKVDNALDLLSAKVFDKPTMYVGSKFMRKFKYVMTDTIRTNQENDERGIGVVGTYLSHLYGKIKVVLIQERTGYMDNRVFFLDESDLGEKAMKGREWQTYPLGRRGDSFQWQILSERTMKMGNPDAHCELINLGF